MLEQSTCQGAPQVYHKLLAGSPRGGVLGEPLVASAVSEATSRGAALLALQAQGTISDLASLPAPLGTIYHPIPAHTRIYEEASRRQQELYQVLIGSGQGLDTRASRP